ncbi:MAG: DUF2939 domain-containing protein [Alphaproteobacteria bacterium]|nr:DUF2939 domain-containing protein [Alphaproteobacteria bacterium]
MTLRGMQTAFNKGDHEAFSSYIDFERLRTSLKEELSVQAALAATESDNPFDQLGAVGVAAIADPMVEQLVNPTAIRIVFQRRSRKPDDTLALNFVREFDAVGGIERSGINTFSLRAKDRTQLIFERQWFSWKLVGVRLPSFEVKANQGVDASEEQIDTKVSPDAAVTESPHDELSGYGGTVHRDELQTDCDAGDEFACEQLGEMGPDDVWYNY